MAELSVDDADIVARLSPLERLGALRGDVRVPLASVRVVRASADLWSELRGIRAPGTGIPGVIALGTRRGGFGKDFAAVYRRGPGVVIELVGADLQKIVVSADDPDRIVTEIRSHLG